jgi:hypothetical protein
MPSRHTRYLVTCCSETTQGLPLSPILFSFFNSDLVDQPVDFFGGASAYIGDYFRWRVGRSAEDNIKKIQEEDIPRIVAWARRTGSCFAVEKTELIHITRKKREHSIGQIIMQGTIIQPSPTAKLLGVIFDQELRWKQHVQQAVKRATKVNIAAGGLRHLRPAQMRAFLPFPTCSIDFLLLVLKLRRKPSFRVW